MATITDLGAASKADNIMEAATDWVCSSIRVARAYDARDLRAAAELVALDESARARLLRGVEAMESERDAARASRDQWRRLAGEGAAIALALVEDEHAVGERGDVEDDLADWARGVDARLTDPFDK